MNRSRRRLRPHRPGRWRERLSRPQLVSASRLVITDSGGVQEETTYLDIPCLTLRESTERPITITQGSNRLVTAATLLKSVETVLGGAWPHGRRPALWDGHTAGRVVDSLRRASGA